jgi:hypothetical protein
MPHYCKTPLLRLVCALPEVSGVFEGCPIRQLKGCAPGPTGHYSSLSKRGCSSVVEHLLAKEDVASSSLVTRSLAFCRDTRRRVPGPGTASAVLSTRGRKKNWEVAFKILESK